MKIVVVGGVAAGATAAVKARRTSEDAEIIILEKGRYVSFANCGLPYYVGGDIPKKESLLLVSPEMFEKRFNIRVRTGQEAVGIDTKNRTVRVVSRGEESYEESYDKLILAPGGEPVRPPWPGAGLPEVYTVFTVPDAEAIAEHLGRGAGSAVIVGGGFIGLETAEALLKKGVAAALVEKLPQLAGNFDPEFSLPLERHLTDLGLKLFLGQGITKILGADRVEGVELEDGTRLKADLVILAIGVRPRLELAKTAGLALGPAGGVAVDAGMRTSDPHIYAAGDIVESLHLVSGKMVRIPLAGSANKQGRVAGANAAGGRMLFRGVLGTAILKVGELTAARTGLSEREAGALGREYEVSYSPAQSHATYYPGAKPLLTKLVFEKFSGRVLGAQIIGRKGVDKRVDVLAAAIYGGLTVMDLEQLDLAYAPPFSSAKDPVIVSGMAAANILRGEVRHLTWARLREMMGEENVQLVDVRTGPEYERGALPGAVNIPLDELRVRFTELDINKKTVLYCGVGYRSYLAYRFLAQKGYPAYNLSGGYSACLMTV